MNWSAMQKSMTRKPFNFLDDTPGAPGTVSTIIATQPDLVTLCVPTEKLRTPEALKLAGTPAFWWAKRLGEVLVKLDRGEFLNQYEIRVRPNFFGTKWN